MRSEEEGKELVRDSVSCIFASWPHTTPHRTITSAPSSSRYRSNLHVPILHTILLFGIHPPAPALHRYTQCIYIVLTPPPPSSRLFSRIISLHDMQTEHRTLKPSRSHLSTLFFPLLLPPSRLALVFLPSRLTAHVFTLIVHFYDDRCFFSIFLTMDNSIYHRWTSSPQLVPWCASPLLVHV